MTTPLTELAWILEAAGDGPPTGRELAELLWLAQYVQVKQEPPAEAAGSLQETRAAAERTATATLPPSSSPAGSGSPPLPAAPPAAERVPLFAPADGRSLLDGAQESVLAPAPPMLSRPLEIQRALRPLRRTVPSPYAQELDETETAHRIAATGAGPEMWLPVLRPRRERWLQLRLVFDSGPTMTMWEPLLHGLRTAVGQTGMFRTVEVLRLGPDGRVPARAWLPGRTLVLVISDCMGPQWWASAAGSRWYRTLRRWATALPVAVVQPLPERLWDSTPFPAVPGLLSAPYPGAPDTALGFAPYEKYRTVGEGSIPVPVLELAPEWLGHWASLVASAGAGEVPGAAAWLSERPPSASQSGAPTPEETGAEALVLRFRATASPAAFWLASHLAVGSAHLPVMRLVQAAVEERPEPRHLAEVVLSGMLKSLPGASGAYDFRPGVREVLLGTLPRSSLSRTARLLGRVSSQIEARAGTVPGEFRALIAAEGGPVGVVPGDPFALVSRESVQLLRGPEPEVAKPAAGSGAVFAPPVLNDRYELHTLLGSGGEGEVWLAHDLALKRSVAVKLFPFVQSAGVASAREAVTDAFLASAQVVQLFSNPLLVTVYDVFATDKACSLVMEMVEGSSLREVLDLYSGALPADRIVEIGRLVLEGLEVLHRGGAVHGDLKPSNIIFRQDGSPVLCDYAINWTDAKHGDTVLASSIRPDATWAGRTPWYTAPEGSRAPESDFYALGCVLYELATGAPPFPSTSFTKVVVDHRTAAPEPLRTLRPNLPAQLEDAVLALLAKEPEARQRGVEILMSSDPRWLSGTACRWQYDVLGPPWIHHDILATHDRTHLDVLCRLLWANGAPLTVDELCVGAADRTTEDIELFLRELQGFGHDVAARPDGFLLIAGPDQLDLTRARRLAAQAVAARELGDALRSRDLFRESLGLWYGEPLDDVPGEWAATERRRLREWRTELERSCDEMDLALFPRGPTHIGASLFHPVADDTTAALVKRALHSVLGDASATEVVPFGAPSETVEVDAEASVSEVMAAVIDHLPDTLLSTLPHRHESLVLAVTVRMKQGNPVVAPPRPRQVPRVGLLMSVTVPDDVHRQFDGKLRQHFRRRLVETDTGDFSAVWSRTVSRSQSADWEEVSLRSPWYLRLTRRLIAGRTVTGGADTVYPPESESPR